MRTFGPNSNNASDEAVTEVIGQILTFGILSMVLVLSMVAFNSAKETATERAAILQAEGVAQQVVTLVVEASLFAETHGTDATYNRTLALPQEIESGAYEIHLDPAAGGVPDRVRVELVRFERTVTAPLFSAGAPSGVDLCDIDIPGGRMAVRFGPDPAAPANTCIFLESL